MAKSEVHIIGVHPLTDEQIAQAIEEFVSLDTNVDDQLREDKLIEFRNTVLIEMIVPDSTHVDLDDVAQGDELEDSRQAPYLEHYLSDDGRSVISTEDKPDTVNVRVAFFLHNFQQDKPLRIGSQDFEVGPITLMPERLQSLLCYHPVD